MTRRSDITRRWARAAVAGAVVLSTAGARGQGGDRELGRYLASSCVACHQLSGRYDGIPPIVGWPEESFIAIINEYRARTRPNPVMQTIAGKLSDEEVAALAAYFGSLPQPSK